MSLKERILHQSVRRLTRFAASLALAGLAIICFSIISPRPLPVILSMSVGQGIGIAAFFCYLVAVILDASRSARAADSLPPPEPASDDGGRASRS